MNMIERIVARCHVGQSNRQVISYFVSRLAHGQKTWFGLSKRMRKDYMRKIIKAHAKNGNLFHDVTTGNLGPKRRAKKK